MIRLEPRTEPSRAMIALTPILAVLATMIAGGFLFSALGKNPIEAIRMIFWDPVLGEHAFYYRGQILVKAAPLIMIALGLSFGFRAGIWNIGAEGQFIMGGVIGAAAGLALYPSESIFVFPIMLIAGTLGGLLWALIPAYLKIKFNANEILVSLMLVYVAFNFLAGMVTGPLRDPDGFNFPESRSFQQWDAASNPELIAGSGIHWGVLVTMGLVIVAYILLTRHIFGFHIRLAGQSPRAAKFGGVNPNKMVAICLGLSGALAGMAGLYEVTGPAGKLTTTFPLGYGFTAIIVAFLGRLHPIGILLAGLLLAVTYVGGDVIQANLSLPKASIQVFQGMLLFFLLAVDVLVHFRIRFKRGL
ncbi:sugar ABC transporter permease [Amylibacter kogurei]|uniref:Sugar ABC transporter permease n=1 Tax=Paramylibacter kogurei TaxID=1889778 RepID=A0A2G5K910_9RHOB|nr:ABC transporter permease [Amylibacter kogurei]PIB26028.1 sugar ABC transporter permease [Amylibacter kogurei]